jgi:glutamate-5-semialdehyde dehydrogenase
VNPDILFLMPPDRTETQYLLNAIGIVDVCIPRGNRIIENAKTRRVSVCNALDALIINSACLNDLQSLVKPLVNKNVEIFADAQSYKSLLGFYPNKLLHKAKNEDYGIEFLSYKMSIKTVTSIEEALSHIMLFQNVDAAAVYANAATAFTDGGEFGMGAEIGISTQKLHARGPMGLEKLTSYKWLITGDGHIRT